MTSCCASSILFKQHLREISNANLLASAISSKLAAVNAASVARQGLCMRNVAAASKCGGSVVAAYC